MQKQVQPQGATAGKKKGVHMTNLDGLRGLGIIEVILYHMGYTIMRHAWLCISIFFALSGLLITGITVQAFERTGTVDVVRFWSRRVGRLFPALFVTISLCAASRFFREEDDAELWYERNDLLWAVTFLSNYNLVFVRKDDYFAAFQKPSITRHMWTLAIEEQYYLIWPILYFFWCKCFPSANPNRKAVEEEKRANGESEGLVQQRDCESMEVESSEPSKDPMRPLLITLCAAECVVILFSYFSSWTTIEKLGMSAAYYSTWSRMGDLACGGLMYLIIRLNPQVYRRYTQQPGLETMNTEYRIILEFLWFLCLCLTVFPPMIQAPLADVLPFYFYYFRLPFSFLICVFAVAGVLQISEPLPKWAVFSRLTSSKPMVMLGVISYGVYLNHWPIILFFGTPIDHDKFEKAHAAAGGLEGPEEEAMSERLVRDAFLLCFSVAFGFVSFMLYEKPLLSLGAKQKHPWKVIAAGFVAAALTAAVVVGCFSNVTNPNTSNDAASVFAGQDLSQSQIAATLGTETKSIPLIATPPTTPAQSTPAQYTPPAPPAAAQAPTMNAPSPPTPPAPEIPDPPPPPAREEAGGRGRNERKTKQAGAGQKHEESKEEEEEEEEDEEEDEKAVVVDKRVTPIWLFSGRGRNSDVAMRDILDPKTAPNARVACMDNKHDGANNCGVKTKRKLYDQLLRVNVPNTITVMCKSWIQVSPCDVGPWKPNNHWVWLSSTPICGPDGGASKAWGQRCPGKIDVHELALPAVKEDAVDGEQTYTGRMQTDVLYLYDMVFALDELLPGAVNRQGLQYAERKQAEHLALENEREKSKGVERVGWSDELDVLVMGESIADRIGGMFKEHLDNVGHCVSEKLKKRRGKGGRSRAMPRLNVINLSNRGKQSVNFFLPCSEVPAKYFSGDSGKAVCDPANDKTRREVQLSIPTVQPDVIVLHDEHWTDGHRFKEDTLRKKAMTNFLSQAVATGVKDFYYMTYSAVGQDKVRPARTDEARARQYARENRCRAGEKGGISFTIIKWHVLTCPGIDKGKCPHKAHGFFDVLPDGNHPSGPAGRWLSAQALAVIAGDVAHHLLRRLGYTDWEGAMQNPVSQCLLEQQPPDNNPPLKQLSERYWICP